MATKAKLHNAIQLWVTIGHWRTLTLPGAPAVIVILNLSRTMAVAMTLGLTLALTLAQTRESGLASQACSHNLTLLLYLCSTFQKRLP